MYRLSFLVILVHNNKNKKVRLKTINIYKHRICLFHVALTSFQENVLNRISM